MIEAIIISIATGIPIMIVFYIFSKMAKAQIEMEFLIRQQDNNIKQLQNDLLDYNKLNEKGYKEVKK